MSSDSQNERERLKEEYKEHYRKIRDVKEKLRRNHSVRSISDAVEQMNSEELLDSVDQFIGKVRGKVAQFEARLDLAMENLTGADDKEQADRAEMDEIVKKEKARETIQQVKIEMGMLYEELEQRAGELNIEKTVGPQRPEKSDRSDSGESRPGQKDSGPGYADTGSAEKTPESDLKSREVREIPDRDSENDERSKP